MKETCQSTREQWFEYEGFGSEDDSGSPERDSGGTEWFEHFENCPDCTEFKARVELDQKRLRTYFAEAHVPTPAKIELRQPLQAASGYPRKVSLSILPMLLALLLVIAMAILAFTMMTARKDGGSLDREDLMDTPASAGSDSGTLPTPKDRSPHDR